MEFETTLNNVRDIQTKSSTSENEHITHCITQWCHILLYLFIINGSGNDLLPDSTKPQPDPILSQIYPNIWHYKATMSYAQD